VSRVRPCTVLAAGFFVVAFGLAITLPPDTSLVAAMAFVDPVLPGQIHALLSLYLPAWVWSGIAVPLLLRPSWLLPASFGIIAAGLALTLNAARHAPRSRRRPR
jgi:hypothetical protein